MAGGSIPDDPQLEIELISREFKHNDKDQLVMERKPDLKKRLKVSPDWADALYLTFARQVPPRPTPRGGLDRLQGVRASIRRDDNPLDALD
jgi:hypothetical protein